VGTIVVGIDGSSGDVEAVLVWQLPTAPLLPLDLGLHSTEVWATLPDLYQNLSRDAVAESRARTPAGAGVRVRSTATGGDPGTTLVSLAQDAGAALLVIGAHGHSALTRGFLGSVAAYCLHHAGVPVAVVPDRDVAPRLHHRGRVVTGCDGSEAAALALRWGAERARTRGLDLVVLHAAAGSPDQPQDRNLERLRRWVTTALGPEPGLTPVLLCEPGSPTARLLAQAEQAEVIVLGDRGRGGFARLLLGSVSSQTVHHATCPVVVVPSRRTAPAPTEES
jgi:nucleotide-binding universal stress UspA family protein